MPQADFNRLTQLWQDKLAKSGFKDIEYRMPNGKTLTYFRNDSSYATAMRYRPETAEFYRLATIFYHEFMFYRHFKLKDAAINRQIFRLFIAGLSYRKIVKALQGAKARDLNADFFAVPKRLKQKRSIYFVHTRNLKTLAFFQQWKDKYLQRLKTDDDRS
jgi:hypothetical protein